MAKRTTPPKANEPDRLDPAELEALRIPLADLSPPELPKEPPKDPARPGRPRSQLTDEQHQIVRILSMIGASREVIAAAAGLAEITLRRRKYDRLITRNRKVGHAALLRKGWLLALGGDVAMLKMLLRTEVGLREPVSGEGRPPQGEGILPPPAVTTQRTTVLVLLPDNGRAKGLKPVLLTDVVRQHGLYPVRAQPDDPTLGGEEVPERPDPQDATNGTHEETP